MNPDLFEPFTRLIEITVKGKKVKVPENNTLLRCFQYLSVETVSYGDFCWNGDCLNCRVRIASGDKKKTVIACLTRAEEKMEILELANEIELDL